MLVALPILDTVENGRTVLTEQTLQRLMELLRPTDRVVVYDNGSCALTLEVYAKLFKEYDNFSVILGHSNLGIAGGTNQVWRLAHPDEIVVKMDADCMINTPGWPALVDYVFSKEPTVGILGLKRRDLAESPTQSIAHYRTELFYVEHKPGEYWIVLEEARHIMGTCYAFSPMLRRQFGYLMQPGTVYGFDDSIAAARAHKLGFKTCFLPQIDIDHLDVPGTEPNDPYVVWKQQQATDGMNEYHRIIAAVADGTLPAYYNGGF